METDRYHIYANKTYIIVCLKDFETCMQENFFIIFCTQFRNIAYLTLKRAMYIRFLEDPITRAAEVSGALALPALWPFLDEDHFRAVNCIRLEARRQRKGRRKRSKLSVNYHLSVIA